MLTVPSITPLSTTPNIQVLDAMMGAGKTTYIFDEIQRRSLSEVDTRFLYVSPLLSETGNPDALNDDPEEQEKLRQGRIHSACPAANFRGPESRPNKRESLKRLLASGVNVACTHALYCMIDDETSALIRDHGYEVIIDEALDVVQNFKELQLHDVAFLSPLIEVDPETHLVKWTALIGDKSKYSGIKKMCEDGLLYHFHGKFWVYELPLSLFTHPKKTTICTYMFGASILHSYLLKHDIPFEYIDNERIGFRPEADLLAEAKELITLVDNSSVQKLSKFSMTKTGYGTLHELDFKKIKGILAMLVQRHLGAKSRDILWTCFKDHREKLKGRGYTRGFLSFNTRATNAHRKRSVGIYLVDRHPHAMISAFLRDAGAPINSEMYGLSEMIQWVWRLRIRDDKDIRLVIPSKRMKALLVRWLDGEFIREDIDQAA